MIIQPPAGNDINSLSAWARRVSEEISRFLPSGGELPVFADDAAAADARVKVGQEYVTPDGFRKVRVV